MEEEFEAANGNIYTICVDDELIEVLLNGREVGRISLDCRCGPDQNTEDQYHITHMELDKCKRLGIGRRCLELHSDVIGGVITAGDHGYGEMDDGSHLVGDGVAFIAKMREEGLVAPSFKMGRDSFEEEE